MAIDCSKFGKYVHSKLNICITNILSNSKTYITDLYRRIEIKSLQDKKMFLP